MNLKVFSSINRGPRFCVTHSVSTKNASAELKFWRLRQEKPRKDVDPFPQMATLLPLRPKSCIPQVPEVQVGCPAWELPFINCTVNICPWVCQLLWFEHKLYPIGFHV